MFLWEHTKKTTIKSQFYFYAHPNKPKINVLKAKKMYGKCKEKRNASYKWKRKTNTSKKITLIRNQRQKLLFVLNKHEQRQV
jgi:16S rRNA G527 N7-methylase RsmG